jgi:cytochrome P450
MSTQFQDASQSCEGTKGTVEISPADLHPPAALAAPVPPEKPLSLFKLMRVSRENGVAGIPAAAYREPIYELKSALGGMFIVSDPAGVKRVLVDNVSNYPKEPQGSQIMAAAFGEGLLTSAGEKWRKHRRIMAPSFDHRSLVAYAPAMVETTTRFMKKWEGLAPNTVIDIESAMTELTLQIISRTMFSSDSSGICDLVGNTLREGTAAMTFGLLDALPLIGPWRMGRKTEHIHAIFSALDASIFKLIEARAADKAETEKAGPTDLLGRLVAARDLESGAGMTTQEVRDEVVIIFIAGHATTAVAMTFVWYLLSKHPWAEAKLHQELATVLRGRPPKYEDLEHLPYTRQVTQEAMRLYPPAPSLEARKLVADDVLCGCHIPKGAQVAIMPWILHRHRTLWDEPDRFEPDRFSPENSAGRDRFAWLPFGGGPRICIGAALALTEASLILATIAQQFKLGYVEDQQITLKARITLGTRDGIKLTVSERYVSGRNAT